MPRQEELDNVPPGKVDQLVQDFKDDKATNVTKTQQPDGNFTIVATFDDAPAAPAAASPAPAAAAQPAGGASGAGDFTFTTATVFGLQMDGSDDPEDNGQGAFGDNTRNASLVGAALPAKILIAKFGSLKAGKHQQIEVTNLANNKITRPIIVDIGPGTGPVSKGVGLDLTLGAQREVDGNGKIKVKYRFV